MDREGDEGGAGESLIRRLLFESSRDRLLKAAQLLSPACAAAHHSLPTQVVPKPRKEAFALRVDFQTVC